MTVSIRKIIAICMFIVSVILAVITHSIDLPMIWAVWAGVFLYVFAGVIP